MSFSLGMGSGRCGTSKRGRKSNSEKAKQPQRGLGVAQLEKIRLQSQMNQHVSIHNNLYMEEYDDDDDRKINIINCDKHWRLRSDVPLVTLPLIERLIEQSIKDSTQKKHSIVHHKYDSNETVEELDLELRLSL
ncbi:hypothetical protein OPV22_031484 [Ensete ventricosum]|uniref:Uncharacterized protein n=1 Tax=Ensete ventricosum TaxID=4639 RepID=A0AAV8PP83_ENSVE|nr:hypothetical protein OPV22_031484 [Ensete ventricosum]